METISLKSKINEIRLELSKEMSKSGKNTFSKYDYFQLKDFMPQALALFNEKGVYTEFWVSKDKLVLPSEEVITKTFDSEGNVIGEVITKKENFQYIENAHLLAINLEDESDEIELIKETASCNLTGAQPIQNLGGKSTYMKRYMYMDLLEINENDKIEEESGKPVIAESKTTKATKPATKTVAAKTEPEVKEQKAEVKVETKVETQPAVNESEVSSESQLLTMQSKLELANLMKEKGLDPKATIIEAAKAIGRDVPLLLESDVPAIKEFVANEVIG
jgi:hypothetical protein